jgi:carboxypeptidase C (cathepsin A)
MSRRSDTRWDRVTHRLMESVAVTLVTLASVTRVVADEPPAAPATPAPAASTAAAPSTPAKLPQPSDSKAPGGAANSEGEAAAPPGPAAVIAHVSDHPVAIASLPPPRRFVTRHRMTIHGAPIAYVTTAGETYVTNATGEPIASFFSFSYVRDGVPDPRRPVMFVFNGGPGSSSIWLHLGAIGPKRLVLNHEVNPSNSPPFGVRDNPYCVLDVTDLVFIDPVGTGFSHAVGNAKDMDFAGIDADADSVARFIEQWLTENGRWNSPKYVMGESYGSVRGAVLSRALIGGPFYTGYMRGITVDGIVLLGVALKGGAKVPIVKPGDDPASEAGRLLPSFAATAWYHQRVDRAGHTVVQRYAEALAFGSGEYADALRRLEAGKLPDAEQSRIAERLAAYTGIDAAAWIKAKLRLDAGPFATQVLESQGLDVGVYDSRYTLPHTGSAGDPVADDPAMGQYVPGFIAAFHDLLREDLHVTMPVPYAAIAFTFAFHWDEARTGVPDGQTYADDLATSMRRMPALRVMLCAGYYDLLTTPAAAARAAERSSLPADRVTLRNYESGHMLYLGDTAERFADDVRAFVRAGRH